MPIHVFSILFFVETIFSMYYLRTNKQEGQNPTRNRLQMIFKCYIFVNFLFLLKSSILGNIVFLVELSPFKYSVLYHLGKH